MDTLFDQHADRQAMNAINPLSFPADPGTIGPRSAPPLNVSKLAIPPKNMY